MKHDLMDTELKCPNCDKLVIFDENSDSIYADGMEDEVWWDNFICPKCGEIYDNSGRSCFDDTTETILKYNGIKERFV